MKSKSLRLAIALTLCLGFVPATLKAQTGADQEAIRKIAEQFFRAVQQKDVVGVKACWSSGHAEAPSFSQWLQQFLTSVADWQFANLTLLRWRIEGDQITAYVRVDALWKGESRVPGAPVQWLYEAKFANEGGSWKWGGIKPNIESALIRQLRSAKTPEARMQTMQQDRDILSQGFLYLLEDEADKQSKSAHFNEALETNQIALEAATFLKDLRHSANFCHQRGHIFEDLQNGDDALKFFQQSIDLFQAIKDPDEEIEVRGCSARLHRKSGEYAKALEQLDSALKAARGMSDAYIEADVLDDIGIVYMSWGKYDEALKKLEEALKISLGLPRKDMEGKITNTMAGVYFHLGKYDESREMTIRSQKIAEQIKDQELRLLAINNLALLDLQTGRYPEVIARLEESLSIIERIGGKDEQGSTLNLLAAQGLVLNNMAFANMSLGEIEEASKLIERSLTIARQIHDESLEIRALGNQAWIFFMKDEKRSALEVVRKCLDILKRVHDNELQARVFLILIGVLDKKDIDKELMPKLIEFEALLEEHARAIKNKPMEATMLTAKGMLYGTLDDWAKAIPPFQAALKVADEIGDWNTRFSTCVGLGFFYQSQKDWRSATTFYRRAIEQIEKARAYVKEPILQVSLFGSRRSPYFGLVKSLIALKGDMNEVVMISEQAKARTLIDFFDRGNIILSKTLSKAEIQKAKELRDGITASRAKLDEQLLINDASVVVDQLKRELDDMQRAYETYWRQLYDAHPDLQAQSAKSKPATLADINEKLLKPHPNTCVLSYFVENDEVMLFAISKGKDANAPVKVAHYLLKDEDGDDLTIEVLNQQIREFREPLAHSGVYKLSAKALYKLLIKPAEKEIEGKSHLIIIPDQGLHTIPFQALMNGEGKHLIEKHTISYAPSITALIKMMNLADRRRTLSAASTLGFVLGRGEFPDQAEYRKRKLADAENQAKAIAELFAVRPLIGQDATRAKAVAEMGKARYIHFATHGELNETAPLYSAIVLGKGKDDDGMLYARDLMDMDIQAELVTLSACNTALGRQVNGEGILGLTWALFVAGAPSSVVTQWSVLDDGMKKLMLEFYKQLRHSAVKGTPLGKAEALRRAQLSLMNDPRYNHPYYWAPTVLIGDWR